jgi:hypothetical protein
MNKIDRAGTFRGVIKESGVDSTKNGFPRWQIKVAATHYWVEDNFEAYGLTEPDWVDWSAYEQEAYGGLVLFNDKGPIFNFENIQKAVGWDGASFSTLANGQYNGTEVLFRMQDNDPAYADKNPFQLSTIEHKDSSPTRELTSLDPAKLKALEQRFAQFMQPAKVAPAKAPAKANPTPTASAVAATPAPAPMPKAAAVSAPSSGPPKAPPPKAASEAPFNTSPLDGVTDQDSGWGVLLENKGAVTDTKLAESWLEVLEAVTTELGKAEGDLDASEWQRVTKETADKLGIVVTI